MLRNLVGKNPRAMLSTFKGQAKATVISAQSWCNQEIERMDLASILRRWTMDALFSVGIMKVGLATPSDSAQASWGLKAGAPFAKPVSLDDLGVDPNARDPEELAFICHRYTVPLDTVRDDSSLYNKGRKELHASEHRQYNQEGDERTQMLGKGYHGWADQSDVQDMVDLWEVYCPRYQSIKVLSDDMVSGAAPAPGALDEPLREFKWLGPDRGPYIWLRMGTVPDNLMPKAPIHDLIELHQDGNHILRKLIRQGRRQKKVLPVTGANAEDMTRLETTDDGFGFRCDNPQGLKELDFGGPSQANYTLFLALKDLFNTMGGNLDLLAGSGPQSPTATQDKMLNENASVGVQDMQEIVVKGAAQVMNSLIWYWWHDPFKIMRRTYQVPGLPEIAIPLTVDPRERMSIPWDELDLRIDPYSLQYITPQMRLQQLNSVVQSIMPLMPIMQQQGIMLDLQVYLEKIARYMDLPDLQEILTLRDPPSQETQSGGTPELLGGSGPSERTYNKVNQSIATDKGAERDMMTSMAGEASENGNGQY